MSFLFRSSRLTLPAGAADPAGVVRAARQFAFDGGAATYFGTALLGIVITVFTLGIYGLWVGPRLQRWRWENTTFAVSGSARGV